MTNFLDLYSDYLICNSGRTTATGLSAVTDGQVSHDQIIRLLDGAELNGKTLWTKIKKLVRRYEAADACLIFDDTIVPKPSMDENDIVCWHWDHCANRAVKGLNLLTAFYATEKDGEQLQLPIDYRVIAKTESKTNDKTGKTSRVSPIIVV